MEGVSQPKVNRFLHNLIETYACKMDAKGRLMLPTALQKVLAPVMQDGFVIKRSLFDPCLEIHPMAEWKVVMEKVNTLNRFVKKNKDFIRKFTAGLKMVEADASGRLLVPKHLIEFAGLDKELVLSGEGNCLEIWDKERYEQAVTDPELGNLAEEVMGGKSEIPDGLS